VAILTGLVSLLIAALSGYIAAMIVQLGEQWAVISPSMTRPQIILNTVGLVLSMAGVLIIFRYGPPQPTFESGVALGLEDANVLPDGRTVAEHDRDVETL
jgi:hypothetical protein